MFKVLIIDDDESITSLLITLLKLEGYQAFESRDLTGLQGYLIDEKPDLVLMDCNLSNRNGLEVLAEVRSNPALVDLPILMTSGIDLSYESKLKGADGFILKPYSPDLLLETIKNQISGGGT
jgi:DNA-binding response OmpR family regulator